ncbi:MAG: amidohydrolase family protein [Candidatus Acidiferrales bacterium]
MLARFASSLLFMLLLGFPARTQAPAAQAQEPADLILVNAKVWTAEESQPLAEAVAIRGNRIAAVGTLGEINKLARYGRTRVLDLQGRLVLPGFIDNHTHFTSAGRLLLGLNLLDVNDAEKFRQRVGEGAARLPAGAWLVGGDWGAYAQWAMSSAGEQQKKDDAEAQRTQSSAEFLPTKELIDGATGDHPALISRFDGKLHLANSLALQAAGITKDTPNPPDGEILRDARGEPTGLLRGSAAEIVRKVIPRASYQQRRAEALRALEEARRWGVTGIHDNSNFDSLALFQDLLRVCLLS